MQNKQFQAKNNTGYQTIWIEDQAPRFVGPDLDPYCFKGHLRSTLFLEIVQEILEGTVHVYSVDSELN